MASSFITVDRKILKWEWYQDVKVFHLFLYFLLRANWEDGRWKGIEVKRGQLITGRLKLSKDTGLTEMEIRTCLNKLKTTSEITIKTTSKYSIITVCKYDTYQNKFDNSNQEVNQQHNQRATNNQPTNNQQVTTNNNSINNKEEEGTTVPLGIVVVKKLANEIWNKDKIWIESLCMGNGLKIDAAKDWMLQFNLSISQDSIDGFNSEKYKKMFAGWLRMKLGGGQKIVKMSDKDADDKKYLKSIGL